MDQPTTVCDVATAEVLAAVNIIRGMAAGLQDERPKLSEALIHQTAKIAENIQEVGT